MIAIKTIRAIMLLMATMPILSMPENESAIHNKTYDTFIEENLTENQTELFTDEFIDEFTNVCEESDIDPWLALSLMQHESAFDPDAIAYDDKHFGLMQLSDKYHLQRVLDFGGTDIFEPIPNMKAGVTYMGELKELCKEKNTDRFTVDEMVIMSYNKGYGWLLQILKSKEGDMTNYQKSVIADYKKYKKAYGLESVEPLSAIIEEVP